MASNNHTVARSILPFPTSGDETLGLPIWNFFQAGNLLVDNVSLKVWSTVKIRWTRVPQKAIVPVGRPSPYSIIILNMRFIP